jgi:hypothetical protein
MIDYALTSLQPVAQTPGWPKKKDLREGQWWDEVGSAVVNAQSRKIVLIGTTKLMYENERGIKRSILISSFLCWARTYAECQNFGEVHA